MTPKQAVLKAIEEGRRIPELESIALQSPHAACVYAMRVVKGEWEDAEKVIASTGMNVSLGGFDALDRKVSTYERPSPEHVLKNRNQQLYVAYTTLVRRRCLHIEKAFASNRWAGYGYRYSKLIYRLTKEVIDLDDPRICVWLLKDLSFNRFAKRLTREERLRICNDLHRRMILHSFARGGDRTVREYFANQKKTENDFLIMLSQHDENMTVGDLIQKLTT
jgi:hypothetical protein